MQGMSYQYGTHLVLNTKKFYNEYDKPITMYSVCDSYKDAEGWHNDELFKSASLYCIMFFLRDLMFSFRGEEIPETDDVKYINLKAKHDVEGVIEKYKEKYLGSDELQVEGEGD